MKRDSTRPFCCDQPSIHCGPTLDSRSSCAVLASEQRVRYFAIEVVAAPADQRTISALDAKTRVTTQQILGTVWGEHGKLRGSRRSRRSGACALRSGRTSAAEDAAC